MNSSNCNSTTLLLVRIGFAVFAAAAIGNMLGLWQTATFVTGLPDFCFFHRITGHDCPGCGMGRSLAALTQGRIIASFHQHPFGPLLAVWAAAWALLPKRFWLAVGRSRLAQRDAPVIAVLATLIVWWLFAKVV